MAYVDILSPNAYGRYNRKLAKIVGLSAAVYWSEVLYISDRVLEKNKFDEEGYFKLDRSYIEKQTTISLEDQLNLDTVLQNLGILEVNPDDPNRIRVFLEKVISILADDNFKPTKTLKKTVGISKTQAAANKKAGILISMKRCISEPDLEVRVGYENWIDSVYAKGQFLTKALIGSFEAAVNNYTTNKSVKLDLLKEATLTGYKEFQWVQNKYERDHPVASRLGEQKIATGVRSDIKF